jgi:methionyl-tRNA formyltransferase
MINFYFLGQKALVSLKGIEEKYYGFINKVIVGFDKNVINDFSEEIIDFCKEKGLSFVLQNRTYSSESQYSVAIGWRWLISDESRLIVFHDSILPRLRGFNPLVTALINCENEIGVTVLFATKEYDAGDIIIQERIGIDYPIKINQAIEKISELYSIALNNLLKKIELDKINSYRQDEHLASYSLWRNEDDYRIDWSKSAIYLKRFIDAVGYPYKGAHTFWKGNKYIIQDAELANDVIIENRAPGKVIFKKDERLFIVCGEGLLSVKEFFNEYGQKIDIIDFRVKFV